MVLKVFEIETVPEKFDTELFLDSMLGLQFMLIHRFKESRSFIVSEDCRIGERLSYAVLGMRLKNLQNYELQVQNPKALIAFDTRDIKEKECPILDNIHRVLEGSSSDLILSFVPSSERDIRTLKEQVEELASSDKIRISKNFGDKRFGEDSGSAQSELYYDSGRRRVTLAVLNNLNDIIVKNGVGYRSNLILTDGDNSSLENYLLSKMLVLGEKKLRSSTLKEIWNEVRNCDSFPISYRNAEFLINFPEKTRRLKVINTEINKDSKNTDSISLGSYVEGSVREDSREIKIDPSTLNLGTLITGLPGTGKTFAAMNILDQLKGSGSHITIIAPTEEWGAFANKIGIRVLKFHDEDFKINFFRCENTRNKEKFYENLAMLLAHASNAGPYKNSMEKCLLSAFSKIYSETLDPDPNYVYEKIEEMIIENHGKRNNTGVRYSKHGENIRAALQNLRLILLKPQFAYNNGLELFKIIREGMVFDISGISNSMKPFFYALTLNQIYSFADLIDEKGNDELRMVICLEEAQLIFDSDEQSAAMLDLRQRIQDFRKKGIGVMLITHSVTDINLRIRRLCQNKIYFRQSADSVKYAANDLIFEGSETEELEERLKMLEYRICVVNYVSSEDKIKKPEKSLFLKIPEYFLKKEDSNPKMHQVIKRKITRINLIKDREYFKGIRTPIEIKYLGEPIMSVFADENGQILIENLLEQKKYKMVIPGKTKKSTRIFDFYGGCRIDIDIGEQERENSFRD